MASADDHITEVVGVLIELPDTGGSALRRAERVLAAMEKLRAAGFVLVLLPAGAHVAIRTKQSRRRWWRSRREEGASA